MLEIVGKELKDWRDILSTEELTDYDKTIINIILQNYETLSEYGTAGGKRAIKMAEYINSKNGIPDTILTDLTLSTAIENKKVKRLKKISIESFRGFALCRNFDLNKQYVLLYGPNGSGKSSFCEALEYGLLDSIQEADANKITLTTFIKNTFTKHSKAPEILCVFDDDSEGTVKSNFDAYRFSFIEKNRITDFSHISALNSKSQSDRIAALFGLSEFNDFVQGFTYNLTEHHLLLKSETEDNYNILKKERDINTQNIQELKESLIPLDIQLSNLFSQLNSDINTAEKALDYLNNSENGKLTKLIQEKTQKTILLLRQDEYQEIRNKANSVLSNQITISNDKKKLTDLALEVNYQQLYEAICKLDESDCCPACGTLLINAKRNPYEHARKELNNFSEINQLKQNINNNINECKNKIDEIIKLFNQNKSWIQFFNISPTNIVSIDLDNIKREDDILKKWIENCKILISLPLEGVSEKIINFNKIAEAQNSLYQKELDSLMLLRDKISRLNEQKKERERQITEKQKKVDDFDTKNEELINKIQTEKKLINFNINIIKAYEKIINSLKDYNNKLPQKISKNLEEKIIEYYNIINCGDATFEMIKTLTLPIENTDKIEITFQDNSKADALHVLSEGHIKILGLSILLAKAIQEKLSFLIFDDIVNAIDDDHRNGVADLLINHPDFSDCQIILSSHGEQFINKLQDRLGHKRAKDDAVVYRFLPADSLTERGIIADYSDAKAPLAAAKDKLDKNELKDSASKCRQALECIANNLWNVITNTPDGMISVGMRSPKSLPDLSSIVDGLRKKTKSLDGMKDIYDILEVIKSSNNWTILNKGTHYEDEQKEFERNDVKTVYDNLEKLDELVRNIRITQIASVKNPS